MKHIKSERLKKLEAELNDLEQWLKLGLVPKKDIDKHKEEIRNVHSKIEEEKERLQFLKESGEVEEYVTPKRASTRTGYTEMPTIPDVEIGETAAGMGGESHFELETEGSEVESTETGDRDEEDEDRTAEEGEEAKEEEESPFSDRNRWRRGGIIDPDANDW